MEEEGVRHTDLGLSENQARQSIVFQHFEKRGGKGSGKGTNWCAKLMKLGKFGMLFIPYIFTGLFIFADSISFDVKLFTQ